MIGPDLGQARVGDGGGGRQIALADDDRDRHAIDRRQADRDALRRGRGRAVRDRHRITDGAEQEVSAIFAIGQTLGRAHADADRLRLVGRQRHPARAVHQHVEHCPFRRCRVGRIDLLEAAIGTHAAQFGGDAVGRRRAADIVEHDFRAARPIEHDAGRRDEQVALRIGGDGGKPRHHRRDEQPGAAEVGKKGHLVRSLAGREPQRTGQKPGRCGRVRDSGTARPFMVANSLTMAGPAPMKKGAPANDRKPLPSLPPPRAVSATRGANKAYW